ncbi:MAG: hypothetical protein COA45_07005 [Zetaproteobacteria bacterium]|nr:MAG: hypothetical protein COA45_07005 [Zetaproteobacteria bacterium]
MYRILLVVFLLILPQPSFAHQPVMDMAPRWDDGFGFQLRYESYGSDDLLDGDTKISNLLGLKRYVNKIWLEGLYTFDRSVRVTFKLPYVDQSRTKNINGVGVRQSDRGLGDLIIGVPFKKYMNKSTSTSNISLTPSVRIPTGSTSGDFPISDGSWDGGLSLSYSKSTPKTYQLYDLFYWYNTQGEHGMREGNEVGLDINLGYHPYHDNLTNSGVFIMWDVSARYHDDPNAATLTTATGGTRIQTGPLIVLYRNNVMFRAEYKIPAYEKTRGISNSRGREFNLGIGLTF